MNELSTKTPGWIYSFVDYQSMFALTDQDLTKKILDYWPAMNGFAATMHAQQHSVIVVDPWNEPGVDLAAASQNYLAALRAYWQTSTVNAIEPAAMVQAESVFLQDHQQYPEYYWPQAELTTIVEPRYFDLALVSDWFFSQRFSEAHTAVHLLNQLCHWAEEVRLFPLSDVTGSALPDIGPLLLNLQQRNLGVEVREVSFKGHPGGGAMLRVWSRECQVV